MIASPLPPGWWSSPKFYCGLCFLVLRVAPTFVGGLPGNNSEREVYLMVFSETTPVSKLRMQDRAGGKLNCDAVAAESKLKPWGALKLEWFFRDIPYWGKGIRPFHHHVILSVEQVSALCRRTVSEEDCREPSAGNMPTHWGNECLWPYGQSSKAYHSIHCTAQRREFTTQS